MLEKQGRRKMKPIVSALVMGLIVGGLNAGALATAHADAASEARAARPMSVNELYQLYGGRSWIWKDGAGYFGVKQRKFAAYSGKGKSASLGTGTWFISDRGKVCFRANWQAAAGSARALSCFAHRIKNGVIYQRREPSGDWYAFRNAPARRGDEFFKLREGNYVAPKLPRIEAALGKR
jgi:hypothetical protein